MGRLFWKFFFILWLAQLATAASVATTVWAQYCWGKPNALSCSGPVPFGPEFRDAEQSATDVHPGVQAFRFLPNPLIPFFGILLGSLVFAAVLAWYFSRPIRSLRIAFESVAAGKLETRIGAAMGRRSDELADLGKNFDYMAGRLQSLVETQSRLFHDVSHELRSPLARLQAIADLMQQQPERSAEFVERIQRDTTRVDTLIGELLTLARLDAGMVSTLDGEFDLYEMIVEISDNAGLEAVRKNCSVQVDLSESVFVQGNYELLYRAIENVVRNAVNHSPEAGIVVISAQSAGNLLRITVVDSGSGVSNENLEKIFEPFVRSGTANASTGYGLGLAITRRVAELHGGRAFASNRPSGGLLVTLELQLGRH